MNADSDIVEDRGCMEEGAGVGVAVWWQCCFVYMAYDAVPVCVHIVQCTIKMNNAMMPTTKLFPPDKIKPFSFTGVCVWVPLLYANIDIEYISGNMKFYTV